MGLAECNPVFTAGDLARSREIDVATRHTVVDSGEFLRNGPTGDKLLGRLAVLSHDRGAREPANMGDHA